MRAIASPIIIVALIMITLSAYLEYTKMKVTLNNINNEIKLDIASHNRVLNKISKIAKFKHKIYSCAQHYDCTNLTSFLYNVSECAGTKVYYDGTFYAYFNGKRIQLHSKYMGC